MDNDTWFLKGSNILEGWFFLNKVENTESEYFFLSSIIFLLSQTQVLSEKTCNDYGAV